MCQESALKIDVPNFNTYINVDGLVKLISEHQTRASGVVPAEDLVKSLASFLAQNGVLSTRKVMYGANLIK